LKSVVPSLTHCRAYDIVVQREVAFVQELDGRWGISVTGTRSAEQAGRAADIIITAGSIEEKRRATLAAEWLAPGSLTVTLDYDSHVTDAAIAADLVLTDD
jgi:ornithine cyclodeaminase/alanine dehydrogenase-like protein (mu-crystallin family)